MDILRYLINSFMVTRHVADMLYISSGISMTPSIGMTLGIAKTEKLRIAGLRMTSDRLSCSKLDLDVNFGTHSLIESTWQSDISISVKYSERSRCFGANCFSDQVTYGELACCIVKRSRDSRGFRASKWAIGEKHLLSTTAMHIQESFSNHGSATFHRSCDAVLVLATLYVQYT